MDDINELKENINISYNNLIKRLEKIQMETIDSVKAETIMECINEIRDVFDYSFIVEGE